MAEEGGERRMWILPVGEAPPFRQVVEDGIRRELPPPPGSLPPRAVEIRAAEQEADEESDDREGKSIVLALGRLSGPVMVAGGAKKLRVVDAGKEGGEAKPWLEFTTPESGDLVVVLWRGGESWDEANSRVLPATWSVGSVVFANVSPAAVGLEWRGERPGLKPGQVLRSEIGKTVPAPLVASVVGEKGRSLRLARRSIEQSPEEASLVVFFRADGWRPRAPVKMVVIRMRTKA
ncbi:MAG: hypothetical protein MUF31_06255 [Akkermansiaceae bacterium]|jgi:hypothetical protein|nr:hypothetical protein [Akkermansiaceae bacterium]